MAFPSNEREILLKSPGIGPGVIDRLEALGVDSLEALCAANLEELVRRACHLVGSAAWRNRQRALQRALGRVLVPHP